MPTCVIDYIDRRLGRFGNFLHCGIVEMKSNEHGREGRECQQTVSVEAIGDISLSNKAKCENVEEWVHIELEAKC